MLSKSLGQILRISVAMHILFYDEDDDGQLSETVTQTAIEAAIDFVDVCCQHTAYIAGRGNIDEELKILETGTYVWNIAAYLCIFKQVATYCCKKCNG